jgi:hypothetical protein
MRLGHNSMFPFCQVPLIIWYKASLGVCSLIIPLSADFTQADVQDNQMYPAITSLLPNEVRYMAADLGYDDHKLYKFSTDKGFELVCPISEIYNHTSSDRLQLINFYDSELGQAIYSWRTEHICRADNRAYQRCLQNSLCQ